MAAVSSERSFPLIFSAYCIRSFRGAVGCFASASKGHIGMHGGVVRGPAGAEDSGAEVEDAVGHSEKPGIAVPVLAGICDQVLGFREGEHRIQPRTRLALDCPLQLLFQILALVDLAGYLGPHPNNGLGEAADFPVAIFGPPLPCPDQPPPAPVVKPDRVSKQTGEQLGIAGVAPVRQSLGGLSIGGGTGGGRIYTPPIIRI